VIRRRTDAAEDTTAIAESMACIRDDRCSRWASLHKLREGPSPPGPSGGLTRVLLCCLGLQLSVDQEHIRGVAAIHFTLEYVLNIPLMPIMLPCFMGVKQANHCARRQLDAWSFKCRHIWSMCAPQARLQGIRRVAAADGHIDTSAHYFKPIARAQC
jgi:hypothetical protein